MKRPTRIYHQQQNRCHSLSYLNLLLICNGFQPLASTIIIYLRCSDCYFCYCLFLYIFVHLLTIYVCIYLRSDAEFNSSPSNSDYNFRTRRHTEMLTHFYTFDSIMASPGGRAVYGVGLRPLACKGCGLESRRGPRMPVSYECFVLSGRGLCDGPNPRGVCVCVRVCACVCVCLCVYVCVCLCVWTDATKTIYTYNGQVEEARLRKNERKKMLIYIYWSLPNRLQGIEVQLNWLLL